jgi:hypothetical protein
VHERDEPDALAHLPYPDELPGEGLASARSGKRSGGLPNRFDLPEPAGDSAPSGGHWGRHAEDATLTLIVLARVHS